MAWRYPSLRDSSWTLEWGVYKPQIHGMHTDIRCSSETGFLIYWKERRIGRADAGLCQAKLRDEVVTVCAHLKAL